MGGIPLKDVLTLSELAVVNKRKRRSKKGKKSNKNNFEQLEREMKKNTTHKRFRQPEVNMLPPQPLIKAKAVDPSYRHYLKYLPRATIDNDHNVGKEAINTLPPSTVLKHIKPLKAMYEDFESFHIKDAPWR